MLFFRLLILFMFACGLTSPTYAAAPVTKKPLGVLKIKAGVVMNSGDVKYIAKQKFFLLDKAMMLNTSNAKRELLANLPPKGAPACSLNSRKFQEILEIEKSTVFQDTAPHIKYECTTSFTGDCTFQNVSPGTYYLSPVNDITVGFSHINWDLKVIVKPGHNYIELSNDNSTEVYAAHGFKDFIRDCD